MYAQREGEHGRRKRGECNENILMNLYWIKARR
jgi:hypothetical protein